VSPPKLVSSERNLKLPASIQALEEAVIYSRANGYVARCTIERDLGATLQISTGLEGGERLVQVASADLTEGQRVEAVAAKAPAPSPSGSAGK
jgi:hypothetical protein